MNIGVGRAMGWQIPKHGRHVKIDNAAPGVDSSVQMNAEASGRAIVYQSGRDQYIHEQSPPYKLGQIPLPAPVPEYERLMLQPSKMLRTNFEIVPFRGRKFELDQLKKWRDSSTETAVQLIYGPGGQGKTRLATHLGRTWATDGWSTLWAFSHSDFFDIETVQVSSRADFYGELIVVDYAERWAVSDLLALLRHAASPAKFPVRIILLARPSGTWWNTIAYRLERDLGVSTDSMFLPPLGELPSDRLEIFEDARDRFANLLNIEDWQDIAPPHGIETDESFSLVLTTHMAALAAVVAVAQGDIPPEDPADLSAFLLAREWEHWRSLYGRREDPLRTSPDAMRQTVYTATLVGPLTYSDGLAALEFAEIESSEHIRQLMRDHAICYPPQDEDSVLEPLYPDRLGEDFLALTIPGHRSRLYQSDPWAIDALMRLLAPVEDRTNALPWIQPAMNLLTEIGSRWPHVASLTWAGAFVIGKHHRRLP